ncbi:MAG: hypothetical protein ACXWVT_01410 [Burkholderiaceae bacterium]
MTTPHPPPSQSASMRAQREFMAAMTLAAELGMQPLVAHCYAGLGRLQAGHGDVIPAAEHFAKAASMYRALGMHYWSIQLEGDVVALGVPIGDGSTYRQRAPLLNELPRAS